jgi:hypothetical protein
MAPVFGNAELRADNAHLDINKFVGIVNRFCPTSTADFRNGGTNDLCASASAALPYREPLE